MGFSNWFCLKDRPSFTIDPQINPDDGRYYFGRDDIKKRLERQLRRSFITPGIPKMMVYGPYGSGKTQTLYYLQHYLKTMSPESAGGRPRALYVTIEMRSNSTAAHLHMQVMEALGKDIVSAWVRSLFDKSPNLDAALQQVTDDINIAMALKELRAVGESTFTAWRWLEGQVLKSSELSGLGLTRNLVDVGAGDLVNALVAVGTLASRVGEKLIFLIDEFEELQNVKAGDATESIHQYLRRLAEPANSTAGFLIGFKADVLDDAPQVLRRGDISSRLSSSSYVEIPPLPAIADVKTFMRELLGNLTDKERVEKRITDDGLDSVHGEFPFASSAFELLADYATQDVTRALPRFIINAINECAIQAWDEQKRVIDESIVNSVAPLAFERV
jgi:DNA polymerase III delta prime subunit